MIRYALKCSDGHAFESWFQSAEAFDALLARKLVTCPQCGQGDVSKAIMAPGINTARPQTQADALTTPQTPEEAAISKLRKKVESESDYVGVQFASEARAIHTGDAPERAIYGEAKPDEAIKLIEDGVPIAPLPFMPVRKTN